MKEDDGLWEFCAGMEIGTGSCGEMGLPPGIDDDGG